MKNLKPRRQQEEQEKSMGPQVCLVDQNATDPDEKDNENGMGVLCWEMEDWYRGQ